MEIIMKGRIDLLQDFATAYWMKEQSSIGRLSGRFLFLSFLFLIFLFLL